MPKEKRKRGPRQAKKRAAEAAEEEQGRLKRQRKEENERGGGEEDYMALDEGGGLPDEGPEVSNVTPFYGMLNEEKQEYFKRADEMLETNQFGNVEGMRVLIYVPLCGKTC